MAFTSKSASQGSSFPQTQFKPKSAEILEEMKITVKINNFIFKDENTGFFVFSASLSDDQPNISVLVDGKIFSGRKFTVVGNSTIVAQSIVEDQEVEVWGTFGIGKTAGSVQFTSTGVQECIPTKPKAIELFLASGKITGVGSTLAKRMIQKFGARTIQILDEDPNALLEVQGVNTKKLEGIKRSWEEWRAVYEIVSTMRLYGVGDVAGVKIFNHFKERSLDIIQTDPYELTDVESIGFKTADKIAQTLGISATDPKRVEKCVLYSLEDLSDKGHCAYPVDELRQKVNENLNIDENIIRDKISELQEKEVLVSRDIRVKIKPNKYSKNFYIKTVEAVAHKKIHSVESRLAKEIHRIATAAPLLDPKKSKMELEEFLDVNPFELDDSQLAAARIIGQNKFVTLTGGPGTGKTHTLKSLLFYFNHVGRIVTLIEEPETATKYKTPVLNSIMAAPTGRAAKRMNESTGKASSTIHRLLGYQEGKFVHNEDNKLDGDVFIIDESSMIDIFVANALLKAIPDHAKVIFVGDIDQLPSVGAGNVLRDLINSKVIPVARLQVIHRQALNSNIIVAAHAIIHEKVPDLHPYNSSSDFVFIKSKEKDNEDLHYQILKVVKDLLSKGVPENDIQVLTPKKESEVGVKALNMSLRAYLNKHYNEFEETRMKFIPGDRVMQMKNNKDLDIYNGDVGFVDEISEEDGVMFVYFDGKRISLEGQQIGELMLSFANTIHKSQGSDYPYVIIPMSHSHSFMWDINLLYTAVTRGKSRVILVGDEKTLKIAVSTFKQTDRITTLKDQLREIFGIDIEDDKLPNEISEPTGTESLENQTVQIVGEVSSAFMGGNRPVVSTGGVLQRTKRKFGEPK